MSWLPETVLEAEERVELGAEGGRAALEECVGGEQMPFALSLVVSDTPSQSDDLPRDFDALRTRAGCPEDVVAGEQAGGQRRGVAKVASDRDGMFAEGSRSCSVLGHGVVQLPGQAGGDLRLDRRRSTFDGASGFFEEGDDLVSGHGEAGTEALQPEGHRREAFGVGETDGMSVRVAKKLSCSARVTGPAFGVALRNEKVDEHVCGHGDSGVVECGADTGELRGGFGERKPGSVGGRGFERPADRPIGAVDCGGCREVAGDVSGEHAATARQSAFEACSDLLVQRQPCWCRKIRVDGFAVQVVRESGTTGAVACYQHPGSDSVAELGRDRRWPYVEHVAEHVRQYLVAGHRSGIEQAATIGRDPPDTAGDEIMCRIRNDVGRLLRRERVGQLAHEKGVTAGATVHVVAPPVGQVLASATWRDSLLINRPDSGCAPRSRCGSTTRATISL